MRDRDPLDIRDEDIEYDPITERYHLSFDPARTPRPSMVAVYLIAHITDSSPLSLPQLQSVVDTDALDTWLLSTYDREDDLGITFTYAGYRITLDGGGNLWACSTEGSRE